MPIPLYDPGPRAEVIIKTPCNPINETELKKRMTYYLQHGPADKLAQFFHDYTCPGDWVCYPTTPLEGVTQKFCDGESAANEASMEMDVTSMIRYRWETSLLADQIVDMFNLPVSGQSMCILWDLGAWIWRVEHTIEDWFPYRGFRVLCGEQDELIPRQPDQGPEFRRPWLYVMAALFDWNQSVDKSCRVVHDIAALLSEVRRFNKQSAGRVLPVRRNDCVPR